MTKKEMIKAGVKLIISFGVGTIVTNAVSFTTPQLAMGVLKRASIGIGSFALSMYTSDKVSDYADEKIDELYSEIDKVMKEDADQIKKEATA